MSEPSDRWPTSSPRRGSQSAAWRVAVALLCAALAAGLFAWSWDDTWPRWQQVGAASGVAALLVAPVFATPGQASRLHRLKLALLGAAAFAALAVLVYALANDGFPGAVLEPELLAVAGTLALLAPLPFTLAAVLIPEHRIRAVSRRTNAAVAGFAGGLLALELVLRLILPSPSRSPAPGSAGAESTALADAWWAEGTGAPRYALKAGHTFVVTYPANPRNYFDEGNRVAHAINSDGLRGPLRPLAKPEGTYRIAILGDSYAFGWGVHDEDTCAALLERALRGGVAGKRVEVLNFGVPGYNTCDQRDMLRAKALAYAPDLVVVWYAINDVAGNYTPSHSPPPRRSRSTPWYQKLSATANLIVSRLSHAIRIRRHPRLLRQFYLSDAPNWQRMKAAMLEIRDTAAAHGAQVVVAIEPKLMPLARGQYLFAAAHRIIAGFCAENGIPCYDLWEVVADRDHTELWVDHTDAHSNEAAKALYVDFLTAGLRRDHVLP